VDYLRNNWKELLGAQAGVVLIVLGAAMGFASSFGPHIFGSSPVRWDEIVGGVLVAWVIFPFWCPMLEVGLWVYAAMLMTKGWSLGYALVASCRSGPRAAQRLPAIVYWYCLTTGVACIYLIIYGMARGVFPELKAKILLISYFMLLGSVAITSLGLAIGLTFVWMLRKLLQTPDEPKQKSELPP
jgi:hypothetical protein